MNCELYSTYPAGPIDWRADVKEGVTRLVLESRREASSPGSGNGDRAILDSQKWDLTVVPQDGNRHGSCGGECL